MNATISSGIDAGWYRWVVHASQHAPVPLDDAVRVFSDFGLGLFALLMLAAWWRARHADTHTMTRALAVPLVVTIGFLVDDVVKSLVAEQRPCQTLHLGGTVEACPGIGDFSFPSNHATIAAATAVALLLTDRRLGLVAAPLALAMAASRVWIGVHYPHDVLAGLVVGALVAWPLMPAARWAEPAVAHLRAGRLRPLLSTS